ncbi:hypothetical protein AGMMS49546_06840 [Spirochaetia bacterium]|nr:hypothetical protein AGMMS49546_06840 [Spirochaetia bacterium]
MNYGFVPSNRRKVIVANHMFYTCPEVHPDRTLDIHDLFYVIDGQESVWLENEEIFINTGDIALLPAKHHHFGKQPYKADTHAIYIHFTMEKGDQAIKDTAAAANKLLAIPSYLHTSNTRVFELFQDIPNMYRSNLSYKTLRCSCLLNLLLTELADEAKQRDVKNDQIIENVLALITNHPHKFYSISELARYAGVCPKSLTSHFRLATGQSIHKYQIESKLEQVAVLLQNGAFSGLKALSINFGFYDEYHLNTCFKKKFGISPVRYSKQFEYGNRQRLIV